jgi:hypothetical protein
MEIKNLFELQKALEIGPYAWPGGYPIYFIMADGGAMSFEAVRLGREAVFSAMEGDCPDDKQWRVVSAEINWEDPNLYCDHTDERIESAYAEEDAA